VLTVYLCVRCFQYSEVCGLTTVWVGEFVIFASTKREFMSLSCSLVINTFCWWNVCIYSASQQFMSVPFWHHFNNVSVFSLSYIHACSPICVLHMRMLNCLSLYIVYVLHILRLLPNLTVRHTLHYFYYISIFVFHLDLCKLALRWAVVVSYLLHRRQLLD